MIDKIKKALKAKYGDDSYCRIYVGESDKEIVEFGVEISRGSKQQPARTAITMSTKSLPDNCQQLVLNQIAKGLADF